MQLHKVSLIFSALFCLTLFACQNDTSDKQNKQQEEPANGLAADTGAVEGFPEDDFEGFDATYENTNRVIWQKPGLVINLLGNLENKTVADIGAGTGFFAMRIASQAKKVIAIDIDPRFIAYLDSVKMLELREDYQDRLETRLAEPDDPLLKPNEADVVMIVNTFMYIKDKTSYVKNLKNSIADGGRLLIIDFKKKRTPLGPPSDIRIPLFEVERILYDAGYKSVTTNDTALDYQYIVIAEK